MPAAIAKKAPVQRLRKTTPIERWRCRQENRARLILFTGAERGARLGRLASQTVMLPTVDPFASPILAAIGVRVLPSMWPF